MFWNQTYYDNGYDCGFKDAKSDYEHQLTVLNKNHQKKIELMRHYISELEGKLEVSDSKLIESKEQVILLEQNIIKIDSEMKKLCQENEELVSEQIKNKKKIISIEEEVYKLESEIKSMEEKNISYSNLLSEAKEELSIAEADRQVARQELENMAGPGGWSFKVKELENQLKKLIKENSEERKEFEEYCKKIKEENNSLKEQISSVNALHYALNEKNKNSIVYINEILSDLNYIVDKLRN